MLLICFMLKFRLTHQIEKVDVIHNLLTVDYYDVCTIKDYMILLSGPVHGNVKGTNTGDVKRTPVIATVQNFDPRIHILTPSQEGLLRRPLFSLINSDIGTRSVPEPGYRLPSSETLKYLV